MVLCRKNRPCGLKFDCGSGGGGGSGGGSVQDGGLVASAAAQLPPSCSQQAHMAVTHLSNGFAGGGLHDFHPVVGKQQQQDMYSRECGCSAPVETAQFPSAGPTQVLDHLYIGSQADALDPEVMQRCGITHVINVSATCPQSHHVPEANFLRIPVNDGYTDRLLPHFQRAFNFLERVRETSGRCLVHCLAGISRSPTLSIAYIMMRNQLPQDEAYRFVKQRRQHISPNFNFLGQLLELERQLRPPAASDRRPEAKRLRTAPPGGALGGPLCLAAAVAVAARPRSVLLGPAPPSTDPGVSGGVSSGVSGSSDIRRSRSSDAFLLEPDGGSERPSPGAQEAPPAGAVACLS